MGDILVGIIILAILGGAVYKLYWNKKNNIKCSGCTSCPSNVICNSSEQKKNHIV